MQDYYVKFSKVEVGATFSYQDVIWQKINRYIAVTLSSDKVNTKYHIYDVKIPVEILYH
jgi:hypothetical protein